MPLCIDITDFKTAIAARQIFTNLTDLKSVVAACNYHTGHTDLKAEISAKVPYLDLKTAMSAGFPADNSGPYIIPETYPLNGEGGISTYGPIFIVVEDLISGIDKSSLELTVNSITYNAESSEVTFLDMNAPYRYVIRFVPGTAWGLDSTVNVSIFIKDRAGNPGIVNLRV